MTHTQNTETAPSTSHPPPLSPAADAEGAEDRYFDALLAGDAERIDELLAEDFVIVDVMSGGVADRTSFVAALRDRRLEFHRVRLVERSARRYGDSAILVGRTEMAGSFARVPFAAASRYTHVFIRGDDRRWRLASAQGTRIAADGGSAR